MAKVMVIHGLFNPFDTSDSRSTDQLASDLRSEGHEVEEVHYNPYDPFSVARVQYKIMTAPSDTNIVGHSYGGILVSQTPTRGNKIVVNAPLQNTVRGKDDWLSFLDPSGVAVEGKHAINQSITEEIINQIQ